MEVVTFLIDLFLHLDEYLDTIITQYGAWTYGILFVVIFVETGLVIMPFLPGDSLLFAAGTFAAMGSLNVWYLAVIIWANAPIISNGSRRNISIRHMPSLKNMEARQFSLHALCRSYARSLRSWPALEKCLMVISSPITLWAASHGLRSLPSRDIFLAIFHSCAIILNM
jgi:hypothetical protein